MSGERDPLGELERVFDAMSDQVTGDLPGGGVPIDVVDDGDRFLVVADLPGYDPEDIDVQIVEAREVHVSATRDTESRVENADFVTRERHRQRVDRTVRLPAAVDEDGTRAGFDDGVLTIELQKQVEPGDGTSIEVE